MSEKSELMFEVRNLSFLIIERSKCTPTQFLFADANAVFHRYTTVLYTTPYYLPT